jgi:hypothetical protein
MAAAAVAVALLIVTGCGGQTGSDSAAAAGEVIPAAGASDGLVVTFGTEPNPPAKGDNTVVVTVTNPDGSPVESGNVKAVFLMPAMPSMNMPAMRSDTALQHEGQGRYRGTGRLSMGGTWNVAITVADGSKELATRHTSIVAKE